MDDKGDRQEMVTCPNCDGQRMVPAMSGAHMPYNIPCSDCNGRGRVTPSEAK